jgi:hypothetical protein
MNLGVVIGRIWGWDGDIMPDIKGFLMGKPV